MFVVGHTSNVALAAQMKTSKTPHQMGKVKGCILKQYPDWKEIFAYLNPLNNCSSPYSHQSASPDGRRSASSDSPHSTLPDSPQSIQLVSPQSMGHVKSLKLLFWSREMPLSLLTLPTQQVSAALL